MSKAGALQFVTDLSLGQIDSSVSDKFFDDVIFDLSKDRWFTATLDADISENQELFSLTDNVIGVIAVFFDGRILFEASERELEFQSPHWRSEKGLPVAYSAENEDDRSFRFYKMPDFAGKLTILHTEKVSEIPDWMELPVAFAILKKEFSRESSHQDFLFSDLCGQLSELLFSLFRE